MQIIDFKVNFLKNLCLHQSKKLTPAPAKNTAKQKIQQWYNKRLTEIKILKMF